MKYEPSCALAMAGSVSVLICSRLGETHLAEASGLWQRIIAGDRKTDFPARRTGARAVRVQRVADEIARWRQVNVNRYPYLETTSFPSTNMSALFVARRCNNFSIPYKANYYSERDGRQSEKDSQSLNKLKIQNSEKSSKNQHARVWVQSNLIGYKAGDLSPNSVAPAIF